MTPELLNENIEDQKDDHNINTKAVLDYYNKKYLINLEYLIGEMSQESKKGFQDKKCFLCTISDINSHHYGIICREKDKKKNLIVIDTNRKGNRHVKNITANDNSIKCIYLGEGLQKDGNNCKTFTIELLKTLSKDNFKIADSLIEFYQNNHVENFKNISNEIWKKYKYFLKLNLEEIPSKEEANKIITSILVANSDEAAKQRRDLCIIHPLTVFKFKKKDFKENAPTILFDVPNNVFKKWEYAGTILQLSQSLSRQLGEFKDIKVGKKKVTLKDRADLYKAKASDIKKVDKNDEIKDADKDKFYSTKIFFKKKEYQNISNGKTGKDKYLGTEDLLNKNAKMYEEFSKKLQTKQEKGGINF